MTRIDFSLMLSREARQSHDHRLRQEADLARAEADLASSDWQVVREAEGGAIMNADTREARALARALISRLRADLAALPPSEPV